MSCDSDTATLLRAAGQKVTAQRMLILSSLRHSEGHISAAQILDQVRRSNGYIDASTVYRTLAAARDWHLVSETKLGGETLFEWIGHNPHHHLICRSCGHMLSLDERALDALAQEIERSAGFRPDLDHLAIAGLCESCLRSES